ncbi:membrane-anchored ubiquitin-fold protein 3 [Quercus suber]|uniref:Membrane-anchored ubiquitin-fold protein 3 n=1 Tax=Quercus suber TaxID=58331 RepID=A0AAW0KX38_QUESU
MGEGEETIELRFRIYDDKTVTPNSVNDVKLIHAGKILEDNKTLADSKITIGDLPGGVVTMHVVVQPPVAKKKTGICSFYFFITGD